MGPNKASHPRSVTCVKRFDGMTKCSRAWDGLHKDEELWLEDGNCLVHLYSPGTSRRGASLKVPLRLLADSAYLLAQCFPTSESAGSTVSEGIESRSDSGRSILSAVDQVSPSCEVHIAAPADLARTEAFLYHVGTRNYFAYLCSKPVVGETLGKALADLAQRIKEWQPHCRASAAFQEYCQEQGYLSFANSPDYALAGVYFAEQVENKDIWIDAFAHCVGMRDLLDNSPEAVGVSNTTKALISRASLEMELHMARVTKAIGCFLEEELGPEQLGLSKVARTHLDRFRSTLHSFYVNQVGYFPPDSSSGWDRQLWQGMCHDFQCVYEYLADSESTNDPTSSRGLSGGICTFQNVSVFNQRHGYSPLPHPIPLLPEDGTRQGSIQTQKAFRNFVLGRPGTAFQPRLRSHVKQAFENSSNTNNPGVMANPLVQEYVRFENLRLEDKLSLSESRKVRWLLVYGVLQMLHSITKAPPEVRDNSTAPYPLCVLTSGGPPWEQPPSPAVAMVESGYQCISADMAAVHEEFQDDRISIHPDCEADNAEDYFSMTGLKRSASDKSFPILPQRSSPQLSRTASIRSSVNSLHRSVVGSLHSRRNSVRRDSILFSPRRMASHCEIVVEGYGNGVDETKTDAYFQGCVEFVELEAPVPELDNVPTLEMHQLGIQDGIGPSPSSSVRSGTSGKYSSISESSTNVRECESPATELSSLSHETVDCNLFKFEFGFRAAHEFAPPPYSYTILPPTYQAKRVADSGNTYRHNIHAGCYTPSGAATPLAAGASKPRDISSSSVQSIASSNCPEASTQAAEIDEEEARGRPRVRIRTFGLPNDGFGLP